jgi:hypothetical protein
MEMKKFPCAFAAPLASASQLVARSEFYYTTPYINIEKIFLPETIKKYSGLEFWKE